LEVEFQSGKDRYPILKGIDLQVPRSCFLALTGPSGVGKTTLLYTLAGILTPARGKVSLLGRSLTQAKRAQVEQFRLQHIGIIFQEFYLFSALTALENVMLAPKLKGIKVPSARHLALTWLEKLNLGHRVDQLPRNLSGGEKQRVAIARALASNPQIILADEPTSALDSQNGRNVALILQQLCHEQQVTIVMATHDHRILDLADRVVTIEDGRVVGDS
jgi:putative ABC transport system ATP-binding protein